LDLDMTSPLEVPVGRRGSARCHRKWPV